MGEGTGINQSWITAGMVAGWIVIVGGVLAPACIYVGDELIYSGGDISLFPPMVAIGLAVGLPLVIGGRLATHGPSRQARTLGTILQLVVAVPIGLVILVLVAASLILGLSSAITW